MYLAHLQQWIGPLIATLLFDIHRFTVCGRPDGDPGVQLWARDHEGFLAMEASAQIS